MAGDGDAVDDDEVDDDEVLEVKVEFEVTFSPEDWSMDPSLALFETRISSTASPAVRLEEVVADGSSLSETEEVGKGEGEEEEEVEEEEGDVGEEDTSSDRQATWR